MWQILLLYTLVCVFNLNENETCVSVQIAYTIIYFLFTVYSRYFFVFLYIYMLVSFIIFSDIILCSLFKYIATNTNLHFPLILGITGVITINQI